MRCYFMRDGGIVGVEMLPPELSDQDAIARAHKLSSKRRAGLTTSRCGTGPVWSSGILAR